MPLQARRDWVDPPYRRWTHQGLGRCVVICAWLLAVEPGLLPSALTERAPGPATVARGWLRRWRQGPGHLPRYARLWREACLEPGLASRCLPLLYYRVVPPPRLLSGSNPEGGDLTSWLGRALWMAMQTAGLVPYQPVTLARSPSLNLFLLCTMGSW